MGSTNSKDGEDSLSNGKLSARMASLLEEIGNEKLGPRAPKKEKEKTAETSSQGIERLSETEGAAEIESREKTPESPPPAPELYLTDDNLEAPAEEADAASAVRKEGGEVKKSQQASTPEITSAASDPPPAPTEMAVAEEKEFSEAGGVGKTPDPSITEEVETPLLLEDKEPAEPTTGREARLESAIEDRSIGGAEAAEKTEVQDANPAADLEAKTAPLSSSPPLVPPAVPSQEKEELPATTMDTSEEKDVVNINDLHEEPVAGLEKVAKESKISDDIPTAARVVSSLELNAERAKLEAQPVNLVKPKSSIADIVKLISQASADKEDQTESKAPLLLADDELTTVSQLGNQTKSSETEAAEISPPKDALENLPIPSAPEIADELSDTEGQQNEGESQTAEEVLLEGPSQVPDDADKDLLPAIEDSGKEDTYVAGSSEAEEAEDDDDDFIDEEDIDPYERFITKYYGDTAPKGVHIGLEKISYLYAKADYDIFEQMKKIVAENDPGEPLEVDSSLVQMPQLPIKLMEDHTTNATYGGPVFAKYDTTVGKATKEGAFAGLTIPVAKNQADEKVDEPQLSASPASVEKGQGEPSAEETGVQKLVPPELEEVRTSMEKPSVATVRPEVPEVASANEKTVEDVQTAKTEAQSGKPEFSLGTTTVTVNGFPVDAQTYTDRTGTWTRVEEILTASNYPIRKDVRKATGLLAGFKNLRRIRPQSEDGVEQRPEVFVNETGLRKMLAKLERQAQKSANYGRSAMDTENKKNLESNVSKQEPAEKKVAQSGKTHFIEFDSEGSPIIRVSALKGPDGGVATIKVDGKDVELPTIEKNGVVWYYFAKVLDALEYKVGVDRTKAVRRKAGNQNVRVIKRSLFGRAPNNYIHLNKEGLKLLLRSILESTPDTNNLPSPTQAEVSSVAPTTQVAEPKKTSSTPVQETGNVQGGVYNPNLRIIIDEHPLFVKGYTDTTTWYATPDMLEFVGIVDPVEQQVFLARTVNPNEIREIYQDYGGERKLQSHVSKKGLLQLTPALNRVAMEARQPKPHPSHAALPSEEAEKTTGWTPSRTHRPSPSKSAEALRFSKERMNINQKDIIIRTIHEGDQVWYEANSILQAAGVPDEEEQTDLLNRIVFPEHQFRPISGASARTFVDRDGLLAIFEALGTILGSSQIPVPGLDTDIVPAPEQQDQIPKNSPMRLGETVIGLFGRQINVKTAIQDESIWFLANDIMGAFNQFQKEEGGRTLGMHGYTKYVNYYVSPENIRQIQQKSDKVKVGTRLSLHINMEGLSELEQALQATREGTQPGRPEAAKQNVTYPSAQDEVNAIAARLHGEQEMENSSQKGNPAFVEQNEPVPEESVPVERRSQSMEKVRPTGMPNQAQVGISPQLPGQQPIAQGLASQPPLQPQFPSGFVQPSAPVQQSPLGRPQPMANPIASQPIPPVQQQMPRQTVPPMPSRPMPSIGGQPMPPIGPQMPLQQPLPQQGQLLNPMPGRSMPQMPQQGQLFNPMAPQAPQALPQQIPGQTMTLGSATPPQSAGLQWPQNPLPQSGMWPASPSPQPMQGAQPSVRQSSQANSAPNQVFVQDPSLGPNAPLIPADVIPMLGREVVIRKKIEPDGAWYLYQDLFDAMGIAAGSPVMAMFANVVQQGAFRTLMEQTPFGYRQSNYVNGMGLIELINELERMTQVQQQPQSTMPMSQGTSMPPYPHPTAPMSPVGIAQPSQVSPQQWPMPPVQPSQVQQPQWHVPPVQPGQVQQQQPVPPMQARQVTAPIPNPPVGTGKASARPAINFPKQGKQESNKLDTASNTVSTRNAVPMRQAGTREGASNFSGKRDEEWLKNEERWLGIFVIYYEGQKLRFVKDKDRRVYVNNQDILDLVGTKKIHSANNFFDPADFVKVWTPGLNGGRLFVYTGKENLKQIVDRAKGPKAKKFFNWFIEDATPIVQANAPAQEGL